MSERVHAQGDVIVGRYTLRAVLAVKAGSTVWAADDTSRGISVAVDIPTGEAAARPATVARFRNEAELSQRMRSPNAVSVLAPGAMEDGTPYIAYELLDGELLSARLDRGPMPLLEIEQIVVQVCRALARAHALRVAHRDIRPENVFLLQGSLRLKVLGFGRPLPRFDTEPAAQSSGTFARPEASSLEEDQASDLRAVGALAYQCLTGQSPFSAGETRLTPVTRLYSAAKAEIDGWFQQAFSDDRDVRFASAKAMAESFHVVAKATTFLGGAVAPPRADASSPSTRRPSFVFEAEPAASRVAAESQSNLVAHGHRPPNAPPSSPNPEAERQGPKSVTGLAVVEVDGTSPDSRDDRNRG